MQDAFLKNLQRNGMPSFSKNTAGQNAEFVKKAADILANSL